MINKYYRGYIISFTKKGPGNIMYHCEKLGLSVPTRVGIERAIDTAIQNQERKRPPENGELGTKET